MDPNLIGILVVGALLILMVVGGFAIAKSEEQVIIEGERYQLTSGRVIKVISVHKYTDRITYSIVGDPYYETHTMALKDARKVLKISHEKNDNQLVDPDK